MIKGGVKSCFQRDYSCHKELQMRCLGCFYDKAEIQLLHEILITFILSDLLLAESQNLLLSLILHLREDLSLRRYHLPFP